MMNWLLFGAFICSASSVYHPLSSILLVSLILHIMKGYNPCSPFLALPKPLPLLSDPFLLHPPSNRLSPDFPSILPSPPTLSNTRPVSPKYTLPPSPGSGKATSPAAPSLCSTDPPVAAKLASYSTSPPASPPVSPCPTPHLAFTHPLSSSPPTIPLPSSPILH